MSKETNPMTFQITEPGFYRQRNGGKAEVFAEREGVWFGRNSYSDAWSWTDCGTNMTGSGTINDIIGPWTEPPEPPAGFQLMPKDYVTQKGDYGANRNATVFMPITNPSWLGCSADQLDKKLTFGPHYIASPIPKPFSISEHGLGIYETRDGREAKVTGETKDDLLCWKGYGVLLPSWCDDGCWNRYGQLGGVNDLVRYIGPLPNEQPWVPTMELRWTRLATGWGNGISNNYNTLEQKWTRGTEVVWKPIEVAE